MERKRPSHELRLPQHEHTPGPLKQEGSLLTFFNELSDREVLGTQKLLGIVRGAIAEPKPDNLRRGADLTATMKEV
jgi:hypothetical protein